MFVATSTPAWVGQAAAIPLSRGTSEMRRRAIRLRSRWGVCGSFHSRGKSLPMDLGSAPQRVLKTHSSDQVTHLRTDHAMILALVVPGKGSQSPGRCVGRRCSATAIRAGCAGPDEQLLVAEGTELAFAKEVRCGPHGVFGCNKANTVNHTTAIFRQIN